MDKHGHVSYAYIRVSKCICNVHTYQLKV
jgi:hypothetical protein